MRGNEFQICVRSLNITYEAVVLAADGARRACIAGANADDTYGRAVQTHEGVDSLDDNAEEAQEGRLGRVAGLQ